MPMTAKELRKLRREDLLEIMIEQQKQLNMLRQELEDTRKQLEDRRILIQNAGSIAEAALQMQDIFSRAQKAADEYLLSVQQQGEALLSEARREAEEILNQAGMDAGGIRRRGRKHEA